MRASDCPAERSGKPRGIAASFNVHVHRLRDRTQQVIVHGRYTDPAFQELNHDGIDFVGRENEVPHDNSIPPHRLERQPAAERKSRSDRNSVKLNFEVRPGK